VDGLSERRIEQALIEREYEKNTCTAVWLGVIAATAQTVHTMTLTLPFAASVGGVTLPAGEYTIRDEQDHGGTSVLKISRHNGQSVFAIAMEVVAPKGQQPTDEATVELKRTDTGYQIHAIWLAGRGIGYELLSKW
jgi:hypothetical protein